MSALFLFADDMDMSLMRLAVRSRLTVPLIRLQLMFEPIATHSEYLIKHILQGLFTSLPLLYLLVPYLRAPYS